MNKSFRQGIKGDIIADTSSTRKIIIFILAASIMTVNLTVLYSQAEKRTQLIDIVQLLVSAVAVVLSIIVVYRQKTDGLIGRAFTFLAGSFIIYLFAEIIRSYNEIGLGIEDSLFPYALWLVGYCGFFYFIIRMYHLLWASHSRTHQILVITAGISFLVSFIVPISQIAELSTQEGMVSFLIPTTYLALDMALLIPSALILLNPVKGPITPIPWIFFAILLLTIGDSILVYTYNVPFGENLSWISNMYFISSYLIAAAGLFWHNRFFIVSQRDSLRYLKNIFP